MSSNTLETFSGGGGRGGDGGGSWSCAVEDCLGLPLPPHVFLARFSSSDMCAQNLNDEGEKEIINLIKSNKTDSKIKKYNLYLKLKKLIINM